MQAKELRAKTIEDLQSELKKMQEGLRKVNLDILQMKEKNLRKPSRLKHDIARVLTLLNEKSILTEVKHE